MATERLKKNRKRVDLLSDVVQTVQHLDLSAYPAWADLAALSANTTLDGIEVDPVGVILEGDTFNGLLTVYVALEYGSGDDEYTTSDAFGGTFAGHFIDGKPQIDDITIDTSSFYN